MSVRYISELSLREGRVWGQKTRGRKLLPLSLSATKNLYFHGKCHLNSTIFAQFYIFLQLFSVFHGNCSASAPESFNFVGSCIRESFIRKAKSMQNYYSITLCCEATVSIKDVTFMVIYSKFRKGNYLKYFTISSILKISFLNSYSPNS